MLSLTPASALILMAASASQAPGNTVVAVQLQSSMPWIKSTDYPSDAEAAALEGTVGFTLDIDPSGKVIRCQVTLSSGSDSLDRKTCALMAERARFKPPKDPTGSPSNAIFVSGVSWRLPSSAGGGQPMLSTTMRIDVNASGMIAGCELVQNHLKLRSGTSGHPIPGCPDIGTPFQDDFVSARERKPRSFIVTKTVTEIDPN